MRGRSDSSVRALFILGLLALWAFAWTAGVHSAVTILFHAVEAKRLSWSNGEISAALETATWVLGTVFIFEQSTRPRLAAATGVRMEPARRLGAIGTAPLEGMPNSSAIEPRERKGLELPAEQEATAYPATKAPGHRTGEPVGSTARSNEPSPLGTPPVVPGTLVGTRRPALPGVHLEDPEWSRALLGLLAGPPPATGRAVALTLGPGAALVHFLEERSEPWAPFERGAEGSLLLDKKDGLLTALPDTRTVVAASRRSALVTVAHGSSERLLADLVSCKAVALDGPPVAVGATLSDIVVELATRRWSDLDELVVVGFGSEIGGLEGVHCLSSPDEARAYLLAGMAARRPFDWGRCIVVAPTVGERTKTDAALRSLVDVVLTLPDTGLVCCDPSLQAMRCLWTLDSHRETAAFTLRAKGGLFERRLPVPSVVEAPGTTPEALVTAIGPEPARDSSLPAPESLGNLKTTEKICVRVLGPVEVLNTVDSLDRRKRITEVIVYLALHREGCTGEALSTAVWPDRRVPTQTVANRLSEARRMLGCSPSGKARLGRRAGRHVLSDIETDWERFEAMSGPQSSIDDLRAALGLVRGRPFEGLSETGWALIEGIIATMEAQISDAACRLALMELDCGDPLAAERAVRRGLLAAPWDERLYRVLMTVCHAAGNRGGVDEALRSLARVLEWEGPAVEGVHPETARLYRRLMSD
jgi:DNA-binding SARP family transcriptional activator